MIHRTTEETRAYAATTKNLRHAAQVARTLATMLQEGADHLSTERAHDGSYLVPEAHQVEWAEQALYVLGELLSQARGE